MQHASSSGPSVDLKAHLSEAEVERFLSVLASDDRLPSLRTDPADPAAVGTAADPAPLAADEA
jgi:hypothetical protein